MTDNGLRCDVLIVDDDGSHREMVVRALTREGFRTHAFANGRDALEYLKRGHSPGLILLDLMMPIMDGWEFRRHQRDDQTLANIPVLVLSGLELNRMADLAGAGILRKPYDLELLLEHVRRHCCHPR
jgi:CheY-like chemotaxis protein